MGLPYVTYGYSTPLDFPFIVQTEDPLTDVSDQNIHMGKNFIFSYSLSL